jgi:ubiquinol-cytochrome c reductase iron-sulfur subunit
MSTSVDRPSAPLPVVVCFGLATLCAMGFAAAYVLDLSTPVLGAVLGGALALIALALGLWSHALEVEEPDYVEERAVGPATPDQFEHFQKALTESPVPRSGFLWAMFGMSMSALGAAALFPLRSLLPSMSEVPDDVLSESPWSKGLRLMTEELQPLKPDDLEIGEIVTVFPEGYDTRQDVAATLLIRVSPDQLQLPADRGSWAVDGVVAYSKLCTHAGCPVGLYADTSAQLLCPCHHSVFNVLDGAQPMQGPASHPLPQLPLALDTDGFLMADGGFSGPVGAAWWGYRE